jgi:hypothetical protein
VTSMRVFRGQPAQSCHQSCEPRPVFLAHSCELHSHTATRSHVSHGGVGADLAFLYKEVEVDDRSHRFDGRCLKEQSTHAHILYGRNVRPSVAAPVDPNLPRGLNTGIEPSRRQRPPLPRICHTPPGLSS